MKHLHLCIVVVCVCLYSQSGCGVAAMPQYAFAIPNSLNVYRNGVKYPAAGLGHVSTLGGGTLTPFGQSFSVSPTWNVVLCQMDSDGDGYSNGQELGDPDCVWDGNELPQRTTNISHPGYADSIPSVTGMTPMYPMTNIGKKVSLFQGAVEATMFAMIARSTSIRLFPMNLSTFISTRQDRTSYFVGYSTPYMKPLTSIVNTITVPLGVVPLCVASLDPSLQLTLRELAAVFTGNTAVINSSVRKNVLTTIVPSWGPNTTQGRSFLMALGMAGMEGFPLDGMDDSIVMKNPAITISREDRDMGLRLRNRTSRRVGVMLPIHATGFGLYCADILQDDGTPYRPLTPSDLAYFHIHPQTGAINVSSTQANPLVTTLNLFVTTPVPNDIVCLKESMTFLETLTTTTHFVSAISSWGGLPLPVWDLPRTWKPLGDVIQRTKKNVGLQLSKVRIASKTTPSLLDPFVEAIQTYSRSNPLTTFDLSQADGASSPEEGGVAWMITFGGEAFPPAFPGNTLRIPLLRAATVVIAYNIPGLPSLRLTRCALENILLAPYGTMKWGDFDIRSSNPRLPTTSLGVNITRVDNTEEPWWIQHVWTTLLTSEESCGNNASRKTFASSPVFAVTSDDTALTVVRTPYTFAILPLYLAQQYGLTIAEVVDFQGISNELPTIVSREGLAISASFESTNNITVSYTPTMLDYPFLAPVYADLPLSVVADDGCQAWRSSFELLEYLLLDSISFLSFDSHHLPLLSVNAGVVREWMDTVGKATKCNNVPYFQIGGTDKANTSLAIGLGVGLGVTICLFLGIVCMQRFELHRKIRKVGHAPHGKVVIVFTDIQNSTQIWQEAPEVMKMSIEMHHNAIRTILSHHEAYEVKTIGDSFMIACASCNVAVKVANEIQLKLLELPWPQALLEVQDASIQFQHKRMVQKGLRVRIGMDCGTPDVVYDEVSKGYDYYGDVVNIAARVESVAHGGQTLVTKRVYQELCPQVQADCIILNIGELSLRGVQGMQEIFQISPKSLPREFAAPRDFERTSSSGSSTVNTIPRIHQVTTMVNSVEEDPEEMTMVDLVQEVRRLRANSLAGEMQDPNVQILELCEDI